MINTVDKLNSFLRGELSAVETYRQAIDKMAGKPEASTLNDCMRSHARRAEMLTADHLHQRGFWVHAADDDIPCPGGTGVRYGSAVAPDVDPHLCLHSIVTSGSKRWPLHSRSDATCSA